MMNDSLNNTADSGMGLDDRFFVFYVNYKKKIIKGGAFILFIVIMFLAGNAYRDYIDQKCMRDFGMLQSVDQKKAFVQKFRNKPLAGFVALAVADEAYGCNDFLVAKEFYKKAQKPLESVLPFYGKVLLGQAMASLALGDEKEARDLLKYCFQNTDLLQSTRAEAGVNLIILCLSQGDENQAKLYLKELDHFAYATVFKQRAELLFE